MTARLKADVMNQKIRSHKIEKLDENLSASSLFHLTNSLDAIKNILQKGFKISYWFERLPLDNYFYIAPMVCFCDIPLGTLKMHLHRYGGYGIGIRKSICRKLGINPIFYLHSRARHLFPSIETYKGSRITPYIKQCYGEDFHPNTKSKDFIFYNEREWRYAESEKTEIFELPNAEVKKICDEKNKNLFKYLDFPRASISYVIVKYESEVIKIVNFINKDRNFNYQEKKILSSKILTEGNIKYDF